jgi:hypothetical protein
LGHFETKSVDWSRSIVGPVLLHELTLCALRSGGVGSQLPRGPTGRTGAAPAEVLPRSFFRNLAPADSLFRRRAFVVT